jgi:hypothetical protein
VPDLQLCLNTGPHWPGGPSSCQFSVHLAKGFQRRRLKCEKLTDDGRQTTDAKWWQKLTLPLARWVGCKWAWETI